MRDLSILRTFFRYPTFVFNGQLQFDAFYFIMLSSLLFPSFLKCNRVMISQVGMKFLLVSYSCVTNYHKLRDLKQFLFCCCCLVTKSCPTLCLQTWSLARWSVAGQAPLPMEFSRQEYCSEQPLIFLGNLPDPGIKPRSPALQGDFL